MGPEPGEERRFVSAVLPWIVAAAALVVYLVTLNHWVSLANYPQVVKTAGWTWQPNLVTPITSDLLNPAYYVATFPLRWLAPKWIPLALNLFSAVCGALTLALLARSVALLPHDRTDEQRLREPSEFSTLSIPLAWLPPLLAVATCGLQLSFWEHSTNGTVQTFDLLLFAYIVCALLEYRIDERESRLLRAAFVCGVGMTNNWVMIGLFPAFITALVWIRGVSFFNLRFLWRMSLCGLAGLLLYLLLPLVACLSKVEPMNFWHALKANAIFIQEKNIARFPRNIFGLLSLTSLLPAFIISIRWASSFGDSSRLGAALAKLSFHFVHGVFFIACAWVAFDPPFSSRHLGQNHLVFYYFGALSVGYFAGYFLLIFNKQPLRSWGVPRWLKIVNRVVTSLVLVLAVVIPAGLIYKNLPQIRATNSRVFKQYTALLAEGLPAKGGVLLSDDPIRLVAMQTWLAQAGRDKDFLFLDTHALLFPGYHRYLHEKYPQKWEQTTDATRNTVFKDIELMQLMLKQAARSEIYYLHPSFGYYFELFYQEPHGLAYRLKRYAPDTLLPPQLTPQLVAENEAFWSKAAGEAIKPVLAATVPPDPEATNNIIDRLFKKMHVPPEPNGQMMFIGALYSRALNYWGVEMQDHGNLEKAAAHFELAQELNPNNVVALDNLEYNKNLRAGRPTPVLLPKSVEDRFGQYRTWEQIVAQNGPFDEPSMCYAQGYLLLQRNLYRQAAQPLDRVCALAPNDLTSRLWLAQLYTLAKLPDKTLDLIKEIRGSPDRFTLTPLNQVNLLSVEASAYFVKNEPAQAGQLLETAVANNPQDTNLLATVASLYAKNKHYTNALVTLDRQLKIAPDDLSALISKGLVCFHLSAYDEAIQTLTHLLTLQTNNYNAMSIRAIAYLHSGQLDAAKKDYETLQAIFPASYQVFYNLGDIAYRRKETNAAVRYYQAYLTNTVPNPAERKFVAARLKELKREKP